MGVAYWCFKGLEIQSNSTTFDEGQATWNTFVLVSFPWMCLWFGIPGCSHLEAMDSVDIEPSAVAISSEKMSWSC